MAVLLGRSLTSTTAILTFHRRFFAAAGPAGWAVVGTEAVSVVLWIAVAPSVIGLVCATATAVVVAGTMTLLPHRVLGITRPDDRARRTSPAAADLLGR